MRLAPGILAFLCGADRLRPVLSLAHLSGAALLVALAGLVALSPQGALAEDAHDSAMYDQDLYDVVEERLFSALGPSPGVFHELISDTVHLDLLHFAPRAGRDFWVVSTIGMSFREMTVPADMENGWFWKRAELMVALPADWPGLDEKEGIVGGDEYFHPLSILKQTARFPHLADTAIAPLHTVSFEQPLGPDTAMTAALLVWPDFLSEDETTIILGDEKVVNLYQIIPIYDSERQYAISEGTEALIELLREKGVNGVYDLGRPPVVGEG